MYRTLDTSFWTDPKTGKRIKILSNRYRMRYPKVHSHAVIRAFVHTRDDFTCQECRDRGGKLHAHHIQRWVDSPDLRYSLDNGMTLCVECHRELHKSRHR